MRTEQEQQEAIADYLRGRAVEAFGKPRFWVNYQLPSPYNPPDEAIEDFAIYLLKDRELVLLQLGSWFGTPAGHVVTAAVEQALPPVYRMYAQFFVLAIRRAAELQATGHREQATKYLFGGLAVAGLRTLTYVGERA